MRNSVWRVGDIVDYQFNQIVDNSRAPEAVHEQIERVGSTNATVLIAQAIHNTASRHSGSFVKMDSQEQEAIRVDLPPGTGAIAATVELLLHRG